MLQKEYEPVHKPINFSLLANWALSDAVADAAAILPHGRRWHRGSRHSASSFFSNSSAKRMPADDR
jgi:hypothetical protein